MTQTQATPQHAADRFGRRVAARLSDGASVLPHEATERLRVARLQALARRKRVQQSSAQQVVVSGGTAALGPDEGMSLWQRIAAALPLIVLAAGLVLIHLEQAESRASELAEVDMQLLTDDLPPAAYADPGFLQYLKAARAAGTDGN